MKVKRIEFTEDPELGAAVRRIIRRGEERELRYALEPDFATPMEIIEACAEDVREMRGLIDKLSAQLIAAERKVYTDIELAHFVQRADPAWHAVTKTIERMRNNGEYGPPFTLARRVIYKHNIVPEQTFEEMVKAGQEHIKSNLVSFFIAYIRASVDHEESRR